MMVRWRLGLALVLLLVVIGLTGWWLIGPGERGYQSFEGEIFATHYRITYHGGADIETVRRAVEQELDRIDQMASTWKPQSELMRYNSSERPEQFKLSPELADLLQHAKQIEDQTDGAFSPRPDGTQVDLSGIAKGYAVDRVVALLESEFGIVRCLVDIGGEVKVRGDGPKGAAWHVGVYAPAGLPERAAPRLRLRDTSIATSGAYFKGDHIIDPRSGQPVVNELLSASVVHPSSATADALATALYVMGPRRGLAWANEHGVYVIFLYKDGTRREYVPDQAAGKTPDEASAEAKRLIGE